MGYQEFMLKTSKKTLKNDLKVLGAKIEHLDDVMYDIVSRLKTDVEITPWDKPGEVVATLKKNDLFIVIQGDRTMGRMLCEALPKRPYYQAETLMRCAIKDPHKYLTTEAFQNVFEDMDIDTAIKCYTGKPEKMLE